MSKLVIILPFSTFLTCIAVGGTIESYADDGQKTIEEGIYNLNGLKLERMQKGINIVRRKDGTTMKVLVE